MKTKKLLSLLLLGLLCSIGNAWAEARSILVDFSFPSTSTSSTSGSVEETEWTATWSSVGGANSSGKTDKYTTLSGVNYYKFSSNATYKNEAYTKVLTISFTGDIVFADGDSIYFTMYCAQAKTDGLKTYTASSAGDAVSSFSAEMSTSAEVICGGRLSSSDFSTDGKTIILGRYSSNCYINSIQIVRPASAPAETYTVTINPNGGSYAPTPDGWSLTDGKYTKSGLSGSFDVPDGLAYSGYDLNGWKDGQGTTITFPITLSKDTTLVAQWAAHATSSDATLSALSVAGCTLNETFDPATTAYTINLPFYASMPAVGDVTATKNDPYAADPKVSISGNVITVACEAEDGTTTKTYTITVTIADVPTASSSINIEQLVLDNSKSYNIGEALTTAHIAYVDKDALDSLIMGTADKNKTDCNEAYLGLKFKLTTSKVTIIVPSNQSLNVKFGAITDGSNLTVSVNGSTAATPSLTNNVYALAASEGAKEVVFALGGAKTVVFKQIMINEAIATVRPFAINLAATTNGTISTSLPKYAKGEEVTIVCEPNSGYQLESLSVSGYDKAGAVTSVTVTSSKFTMPGSPANITATFIPTTVSKTITSAGWATYCSPYALDFSSAIANLEAAYLVTGATGDVVDLDEVKGTVPAGTGLLLKGKGDCTIPVVASSATNVSDNKLVGKTAEYPLPAGEGYVLLNGANGVGFYINETAAFTVGANTAYLPANFAETNAPSAFRLVDEENNATNIENVEANEKAVKFVENGRILILRDGITYDALGRVVR